MVKTLVVGIIFDSTIENSDPMLAVAIDERAKGGPFRIFNCITGQKARQIWNDLNTFEEGDKNGRKRNACN